jgi:hypothetical protein
VGTCIAADRSGADYRDTLGHRFVSPESLRPLYSGMRAARESCARTRG